MIKRVFAGYVAVQARCVPTSSCETMARKFPVPLGVLISALCLWVPVAVADVDHSAHAGHTTPAASDDGAYLFCTVSLHFLRVRCLLLSCASCSVFCPMGVHQMIAQSCAARFSVLQRFTTIMLRVVFLLMAGCCALLSSAGWEREKRLPFAH